MPEPRNVVVENLTFSAATTDRDDRPVAGVIGVTSPSGDRVNLCLSPEQVDLAVTALIELACDLVKIL